MKRNWFGIAGTCSLTLVAAFATACGAGDINDSNGDESGIDQSADESQDPELGQVEEAVTSVCTNSEGTYATMAALAVASAKDLGRWQPMTDFLITNNNNAEVLALSSAGIAQCVARGTYCINTQALLDFQKDAASGQVKFPGNVVLNAGGLRSRLVARWREQQSCEMQPDNHNASNCPAEKHALTFQTAVVGGCDRKFTFLATAPDGKAALKYPAQLKNKLMWADKANPYIGFTSTGNVVSIDPTYGLNDTGTTSTGSCTAACTMITSTNMVGQCCSCNNVSKKFAKAPWSSSTYLCQ